MLSTCSILRRTCDAEELRLSWRVLDVSRRGASSRPWEPRIMSVEPGCGSARKRTRSCPCAATVPIRPTMPMNASFLSFDVEQLVPNPVTPPFYYSDREALLPFMTDKTLAVLAPVVAFWTYSLVFHLIDTLDLLPSYRIHTPDEIAQRNKASRTQVIVAVLLQHAVQSVLAGVVLAYEPLEKRGAHAESMRSMAPFIGQCLIVAFGDKQGLWIVKTFGARIVSFIYWWGIPGLQLLLGMFVHL